MTEPTDKELEAFAIEEQFLLFCDVDEFTQIARAVLAKWGAPQPVAPVWTPASTPPKEEDDEVLVRMADGRCEIAWATYWHGSSNAFAQWTFRDPDEDEQPVEWMRIPKHCAAAPHPTQTQAGAVPLTDEQIEALPLWKRFVGLWPETRREIVRIIESAHGIGIKGGQHGAE